MLTETPNIRNVTYFLITFLKYIFCLCLFIYFILYIKILHMKSLGKINMIFRTWGLEPHRTWVLKSTLTNNSYKCDWFVRSGWLKYRLNWPTSLNLSQCRLVILQRAVVRSKTMSYFPQGWEQVTVGEAFAIYSSCQQQAETVQHTNWLHLQVSQSCASPPVPFVGSWEHWPPPR